MFLKLVRVTVNPGQQNERQTCGCQDNVSDQKAEVDHLDGTLASELGFGCCEVIDHVQQQEQS